MGVTLDYAKLLEPYSAPTEEGGPKRTPEGQRKWLVERHKIPAEIADLVMADVYGEIEDGREFESGFALDRHLLAECQAEIAERNAAAVQESAKRLDRTIQRRYERDRVLPRRQARLWHAYLYAAGVFSGVGGTLAWLRWM